MKTVLKIAIQKKGRLSAKSIKLIKDCGINFSVFNGQLMAESENFPLQILFLRNNDIPGYVSDGIADIGVVGKNLVKEYSSPVRSVRDLGFSKCRLSIAMDKNFNYRGIKDLNGLSIATSYPNLLAGFLKKNKIDAKIHNITGSVEIAPAIGLADAICDLITTGSTLLSNGLKEVTSVLYSSAVLIASLNLSLKKAQLLNQLLLRIDAVIRAENYKYILLNAPKKSLQPICKLLPGMKSPTVSYLEEKDWVSIQSVVKETQFWGIAKKLHDLGAEGILVMGLKKMVF